MSATAQRLTQGTYTRTNGGAPSSSFPRFHMEAIEDKIASTAAGRPIYREEERVEIIMPGNPNAPVFRVTDDHRAEWPDYYERFRKGLDFAVSGTPLEQWPVLGRKHVLELKAMDLHTVEQCAAMSDLTIQKAGMGGRALRDLAKAYLDDAERMAVVTEATAQRDAAESVVAELRAQNEQMRVRMDEMFTELMRLKNAPSPIASFVQGDHDPMQPHVRAVGAGLLPEAPAASALDGLTAVRRGPGRPRKNPEAT